jgi:hypothetical protein
VVESGGDRNRNLLAAVFGANEESLISKLCARKRKPGIAAGIVMA